MLPQLLLTLGQLCEGGREGEGREVGEEGE
jgi:hypothetical protein